MAAIKKKSNQKYLGEERVYFMLYLVVQLPGTQGKTLEVGSDAETTEECSGLLSMACAACFFIPLMTPI